MMTGLGEGTEDDAIRGTKDSLRVMALDLKTEATKFQYGRWERTFWPIPEQLTVLKCDKGLRCGMGRGRD